MNQGCPSHIRPALAKAGLASLIALVLLLASPEGRAQEAAQQPAAPVSPTPANAPTPTQVPGEVPTTTSRPLPPPFAALKTADQDGIVTFSFEKAGLNVPRLSLTVNEDGTALYAGDEIVPNSDPALPVLQHVERKIALSKATTRQIFETAQALDFFNFRCSSGIKGLADTGRKTLNYRGRDHKGACAYINSQDKRVTTLTEMFEGIALTIDIGRTLDFDHRFDRLGLDAATASLMDEVAAGRALEVGIISWTLNSIAEDPDLLERVRQRAVKLLQQAQPAQ